MPLASETVVWLIRHGISTFNVEGRFQGCCDHPELTESGRQDARKSAERLCGCGIETVISSPLQRATQTAHEIVDELGHIHRSVGWEVDPRLREIELGDWEGLSIAEVQHSCPGQFFSWRTNPGEMVMSSVDGRVRFPVRDLYARARRFWRDLLSAYSGRTVLLVTHGGTGRALVATALGLDERHFNDMQQSNCGITRLRFSNQEATALVELLNDTAHLASRLPRLKETKSGVRLLLIATADFASEQWRETAQALERVTVDSVLVAGDFRQSVRPVFPGRPQATVEELPAQALGVRLRQLLAEPCSGELRHLAVIAPPHCLQEILWDQLGWSSRAVGSLALNTPGLTVVHFPGGGLPPVLQAVNLFAPKFAFIGGQVCAS